MFHISVIIRGLMSAEPMAIEVSCHTSGLTDGLG